MLVAPESELTNECVSYSTIVTSTSYFFPTKFPKDTTASIDSLGLRPTSNCFYVKNSRPQFLLFEKKKTDTVSKALT
jgi:hypothetical protein